MPTQHRFETQVDQLDGRNVAAAEPQMRDLLKQLAAEGGDLVRSEMALAKLEMRDMAREIAIDSAKLAAALGLALCGALALLAAAIIGLGHLLDGRFGLAALIIGVLMLLIGGVMARTGMQGLKQGPRGEETARSMRETKEWASREATEFKEEIRS